MTTWQPSTTARMTLVCACLAISPLTCAQNDGGKAKPPPGPTPELQLKAWPALDDSSARSISSGAVVPVAVHIDNPDAAFTGELRVVAEFLVDPFDPDSERLGFVTGKDPHSLQITSSRVIEVGAAQQRLFIVDTMLPSEHAGQRSLSVVLVKDGLTQEARPVGRVQSVLGKNDLSLMILTDGGKLFARDSQFENEGARLEVEYGEFAELFSGREVPAKEDPGLLTQRMLFEFFHPVPEGLPARATALSGMRGVLIHRGAADRSRFTDAQLAAVADFVLGGGTLLMVPGRYPELYATGRLGAMNPDWQARVVSDLRVVPEIVQKAYRPSGSTNLFVTGLRLKRRPGMDVMLPERAGPGEDPLVLRRGHGLGNVLLFAYDPSLRPVRVHSLERVGEWIGRSRNTYLLQTLDAIASEDIGEVFDIRVPPLMEVLLFLGIYLIVLGPVVFVVFSLIGRRELAWLVMPVIALAFAYSYYLRGTGEKLAFMGSYQSGVLALEPAGEGALSSRGYLRGRVTFYSPHVYRDAEVWLAEPELDVLLEDDTLRRRAGQGRDLELVADARGRVLRGFSIPAIAYESLDFEGVVELDGGIQVQVEDAPDGAFQVTITNMLVGQTLKPDRPPLSKIDEAVDSLGVDPAPAEPERLVLSHWPELSRSYSVRHRLDVGQLRPGESTTFVMPAELEDAYLGRGGRSSGALALLAEIDSELVHPLLDGDSPPSQGARHRIYLRIW